eukprot:5456841-Alexandrium_andersonii.AAC.1
MPKEVKEAWRKIKEGPNPRATGTGFIHNVVSKQGSGWNLDVEAPAFQEVRQKIHEERLDQNKHGLPRSMFLGQYFHMNEAAYQKAVDNGEVLEQTKDGITWACWKSYTVTESDGTKYTQASKRRHLGCV